MSKNIAIIVCSGVGKRMESEIPKQFIKINNKPIICYTIDKFEECELIDEIVIVTNKPYIEYFKKEILHNYKKISKVIEGGKERLNSVYNGLNVINDKESIVLIHDGVRPFVKKEKIEYIIEQTKIYEACILAVNVKDTVKISKDGFIESTPNRKNIWLAQTPQAFKYNIIKTCYDKAINQNVFVTDDASILEIFGYKVKILNGDYDNIKITTKEDLIYFNC